jgi:hypothetical protein
MTLLFTCFLFGLTLQETHQDQESHQESTTDEFPCAQLTDNSDNSCTGNVNAGESRVHRSVPPFADELFFAPRCAHTQL